MKLKFPGVFGSAALFLTLCSSASYADPADWLPPGSQVSPATTTREYLSPDVQIQGNALLGKLMFNSPGLLGEKATRLGVSCNSCHPAGHQNTQFFMPGLSAVPGEIDLTHAFWFEAGEDNQFNPLDIPSLQNVANTAPYGTRNIHPTLAGVTRHVIVDEFGGPDPDADTLSALIAYMSLLKEEGGNSAPAPEIALTAYFKLLEAPLIKRDFEILDKTAYLLREELGRRVRSDATNEHYAIWAKDLREVVASAPVDPVKSEKLLKQLLGQVTDQ